MIMGNGFSLTKGKKMTEITFEMIKNAYSIAKDVYSKIITRTQGIQILVDEFNMENASAGDHIQCYKAMIEGNRYTRTINVMAIEYFLMHIFFDNGKKGLENGLEALKQHTEYYENIRGINLNKNRALIKKYKMLIENNFLEVEKYIRGLA